MVFIIENLNFRKLKKNHFKENWKKPKKNKNNPKKKKKILFKYSLITLFNFSRPFFPSKVKHPKPKEQNQEVQNVENTKTEEKENVQNDEEHKNIIDTESFKKMSQEEQKQILEKREAKKKVRCKNWPNCKDPNCEYTHPTQTVRIKKFYKKK